MIQGILNQWSYVSHPRMKCVVGSIWLIFSVFEKPVVFLAEQRQIDWRVLYPLSNVYLLYSVQCTLYTLAPQSLKGHKSGKRNVEKV